MRATPKPCMEYSPVRVRIVRERSTLSLSERVLSRVAHVQEPVLVPVDQNDQLHLKCERREKGDALVLLIDGAHEGSGWRQDLVHEDEDSLLRCKFDAFPDHVHELPHGKIL